MRTRRQLLERAIAVHKEIEKVKPLYKELDEITKQLKHGRYRLDNYIVEVKDNFADRNTVFRPAAVRRFELAFEWKPKKKAA